MTDHNANKGGYHNITLAEAIHVVEHWYFSLL